MSERSQGKRTLVWIGVGLLGLGAWWWWSGGGPEVVDSQEAGDAAVGPAQTVMGQIDLQPKLVLPVRLGERAAISGTVRDLRGQPVAGAQVCAQAQSRLLASSDRRKATCATTERDGHYRIEGLFGVRHRVTASAPGFVPVAYKHGEGALQRESVELRPAMDAVGIDLILEDGGVEIHGVVKDLSGGPIEGAQVDAYTSITWTGADGKFSMWVKPGPSGVSATADGYADGRDNGLAPGHLFEVFLTPEAVLIGKVVRAGGGGPIEGARVTATSGWGWGESAYTDANGEFRIDGLDPGAYKPRAEADDAYGLAKEQTLLGLGETSEPIVIEAHPAFFVEGQIAVEGGSSCDDGSLYLREPAQNRFDFGQPETDGVVRMRGIQPGDYIVEVHCQGYVSAERYDRVKVVDASVSGLKWQVTKGQTIRGVVVDARGKGVAKLRVGASAKPDPSQPRAQQTNAWGGETDAQGRFELMGLLTGSYDLYVHSWDGPRATPKTPTTVTLSKGQDLDGVRIELPATGELRGKVVDAQGRPVRDVHLAMTDGTQSYDTSAADDGTFHFPSVATGEYRVTAQPGWWSEAMRAPGTTDDDVQGEKVEVREGKTSNVKLVVEGKSEKITGVVRDEGGGPVADAFIEATLESTSAGASTSRAARHGRWGNWWQTPHLTDADGRFELEELPPGKHTVRAHRKGGGEAILEHVDGGSDVVLTIEATGRMSGTVAVPGGGAPDEFTVRISDDVTGFSRGDQFYRTGGAWSFPDVPAGNYKVIASAGVGTAEVKASMSAGKDTAGVKVELAPKVTVRGKVVDFDGKGVAGMEVSINAMGSWSFGGNDEDKKNVTDETGQYEVARAPTGSVRVSVFPRGWNDDNEYEWASMPAKIGTDQATVELAPIRVARKRVKRGQASGDLGITLKEPEPGAEPMERRLVVAAVRANGPAAKAGLQVGDEIKSVDGNDVTGPNSYLYSTLTTVLEGTAVMLDVKRGDGGAVVKVTAGAKP